VSGMAENTTQNAECMLEARSMSKWYGEVVALNNIDVSIRKGVTGLLGPNGAGKSTFIKVALGFFAPSRGTMRVLGEAPRNNMGILRRIGYCPETDQFYDNMSGYEFVYWLCRYWGMPHKTAHEMTVDSLERVRMTDRMHDPIDSYSKGMRQRVKLAQALAPRPEILFLDEPMTGLDPVSREEMFALIKQLGEEGYTVIVSSHILYEIERVTDDVVILYHGSILAHGKVREIRELFDDHPHTITVGTNAPREIFRHFINDPKIENVSFEPEQLVLHSRDPHGCYDKLNKLVLNNEIKVESIQCLDDDLQSVFDYLVHAR